mgnify:CR=1 FL=1
MLQIPSHGQEGEVDRLQGFITGGHVFQSVSIVYCEKIHRDLIRYLYITFWRKLHGVPKFLASALFHLFQPHMLVREDKRPWSLYNLAKNRTETINLAAEQEDVVSQLEKIWNMCGSTADKINYFPSNMQVLVNTHCSRQTSGWYINDRVGQTSFVSTSLLS